MAQESDLQTQCKEHVRETYGGWLKKVEPAGENGFPDALVLIPRVPVIFAEFKAPSGVVSPRQRVWRDRLRAAGYKWILAIDFNRFCDRVAEIVRDANE